MNLKMAAGSARNGGGAGKSNAGCIKFGREVEEEGRGERWNVKRWKSRGTKTPTSRTTTEGSGEVVGDARGGGEKGLYG